MECPDHLRRRVRRLGRSLLVSAGILCAPLLAQAQGGTVATEENVRSEPNGTIIGQLHQGASVTVVGSQGQWSQVTFQGVVWIPSLQRREGGQFDLVVSAEDGENLRAEPSGRIIGRLGSGTLLLERGRIPGWVEVERTAWIWTPSLTLGDGGAGGEPPMQAPAAPGAEATASRWLQSAPGGSAILTSPDGDTLARSRPESELQLLGREGNWARVRIEGWIWAPEAPDHDVSDEDEVILRGITAAELSGDPGRFRGRVVEMELQFISLERAEAVRADFQEGEPFLLTRSTEPDRAFVYLAIPSSEIEAAGRMTPLDRLRVVGRVRTGAAALTGSPVLDLLELQIIR